MVGRKRKEKIKPSDTCVSLTLPQSLWCDKCISRATTSCMKPWTKESQEMDEWRFIQVWKWLIEANYTKERVYHSYERKASIREEQLQEAGNYFNVNRIMMPEERERNTQAQVHGLERQLFADSENNLPSPPPPTPAVKRMENSQSNFKPLIHLTSIVEGVTLKVEGVMGKIMTSLVKRRGAPTNVQTS